VGYTNDEKNAATLRIIQGKPGFYRSSLATRSVDATYEEVSELVNTGFFYDPDSVYYLIYLSSNYYTRKVGAALSVVDDILEAIDDLTVRDKPIEDVSSLSDARRVLQEMNSALTRSGTVGASAYSRFETHMDRARDALGAAVKVARVPRGSSQSSVDVAKPRSQAKSEIVRNITSLKELHTEIIDAVEYLLGAYTEYVGADLTKIVAKKQVGRAVTDISSLETAMLALSPSQRVTEARGALLRVLASKGAVKALAEVPAPGEEKLGEGTYRASAHGTGTAPYIVGTISAPWPLRAGTTDTLKIDFGGTNVTVDLLPGTGYHPGVQRATLFGSRYEDFHIGENLATPPGSPTRCFLVPI
jgi:hypothetical protein